MATAKIRKQVYWQEDERVDTPDMTAAQTYARLRSQDIVQFLAGRAPRVAHTGRTWMPYTVWALNGSGITFEPATDNRIKIAAGLRLVLTGGDSGDAGDVIEVSEETILDNYCPSVGAPLLLLMARISTSLVNGDSDDRVFYKTSDGTEETRNEPTTQRRDIEWTEVDATDGAAVTVAETAGYSWVAELDYNSGVHQVSAWYYVFPESEVGGGALTESMLATIWGLKRGLEAAYGGTKTWTDTPDNTLEDDELHAANLYAGVLSIIGRDSVADLTGDAGSLFTTAEGGFGLYQTPNTEAPSFADSREIVKFHRAVVGGAGWFGLTAASIARFASNIALTTLVGVDLNFGLDGFSSLRFCKDSGGRYVIRFRDGTTSTTAGDYMTLRSDGVIELNQTYEVRIPLPLVSPDWGNHWDYVDSVWRSTALGHGAGYEDDFGWSLNHFNTVQNVAGTTIVKRVRSVSARVTTTAGSGDDAVRMFVERGEVDPDGQGRTWVSVDDGSGHASWGHAGLDESVWASLALDAAKLIDTVGHEEDLRVRFGGRDGAIGATCFIVAVTVTVETLLLPSG